MLFILPLHLNQFLYFLLFRHTLSSLLLARSLPNQFPASFLSVTVHARSHFDVSICGLSFHHMTFFQLRILNPFHDLPRMRFQKCIPAVSQSLFSQFPNYRLTDFLDPTLAGEQWSDAIVKQQLAWMEEYQAKYPVLASGNRLLYSSEDTPYDTSFQTYLLGELRTYSDSTLHTYWQFINELKKEGKSLALLTMEAEVKAYGYEGLDAAEKALSK